MAAAAIGVVRLALIGLGRWGEVLAAAASKSEAIELIAGFSRSAEKNGRRTRKNTEWTPGLPTKTS